MWFTADRRSAPYTSPRNLWKAAMLPTNDYIFPLLLILVGVIVFAISAAKILGESKRRANEWLEQQQMREDFPTKTAG